MITSTIGRIFLRAYNQKYQQNYDARTFFDEVYYPLALDHEKVMFLAHNCTFGQPVYKNKSRKEKLEMFHQKIKDGKIDASTAVGFAASNENGFATTSGQVSNIGISVTPEDAYLSWIGGSLGIGVEGKCSILFSEPDILLTIFDGWKEYRKLLNSETKLSANQICKWNGQWLVHRYGDNYVENVPFANFSPMEMKNGMLDIKTQSWTKLILQLSKKYRARQIIGYVYSLGKTNNTIGFIPFVFPDIIHVYDLYKKIFGMKYVKEADKLWGTEFVFRTCCQEGAIGVKAMAPKGVMKYVRDNVVPKVKPGNTKQEITFNTYLIWILAMLNNDDLWEMSEEFAQILKTYVSGNKQKTDRINRVKELLGCRTKVNFITKIVEIIKEVDDDKIIMSISKEINMMDKDNFLYLLSLINLHYISLTKL